MKNIKRFVNYMRRTFKNKLVVVTLFVAGAMSAVLCDDGTFMLVALIFGLPLFLAKEDWFYKPED